MHCVFCSPYGDGNYSPVNDFSVDGSEDVADLGLLLAQEHRYRCT